MLYNKKDLYLNINFYRWVYELLHKILSKFPIFLVALVSPSLVLAASSDGPATLDMITVHWNCLSFTFLLLTDLLWQKNLLTSESQNLLY